MTTEEFAQQLEELVPSLSQSTSSWDKLLDKGLDYLLLAVKAIIVLLIGYFIIRWLLKISDRGLKRSHVSETLHSFILASIKIVDYIFLILIVMSIIGIPTTSLITAVGTAGVAIGLALKDSLSNFASGVLLLANMPFQDGDLVDIGGQKGVVTEIGLMNTTLKTEDNRHIVLPNNTVAKATITNYTSEDKRRLEISLNVTGRENAQKATELVLEILQAENARVLHEPAEPLVRVSGYTTAGVTIKIQVWCKREEMERLHFDLLEKIREGSDENQLNVSTV